MLSLVVPVLLLATVCVAVDDVVKGYGHNDCYQVTYFSIDNVKSKCDSCRGVQPPVL